MKTTFETITRNGMKYILVDPQFFESVLELAGVKDAELHTKLTPAPDPAGNVPAIEYAQGTIIRGLHRDMAAAGLSQTQLAALAKVRVETVNRTLNGKTVPDTATLAKLSRALERAMVGREQSPDRVISGAVATTPTRSAAYVARKADRHGTTTKVVSPNRGTTPPVSLRREKSGVERARASGSRHPKAQSKRR